MNVELDAFEKSFEDASTYAESIVNMMRESLLVLTADLRVRSANGSFYQTFRVESDATENQLIYELGDGAWDIPELRTLLEHLLANNDEVRDFEVEHEFPAIGPTIMLLNARRLSREDNHTDTILLAIEIITERRRAQESLKTSEIRYRRLFEAAKDGILILDVDTGEITDANPYIAQLLGYPQADLLGKELWQIGFFADAEASRAAMHELQAKGYIRYDDLPLKTSDGHVADVEFVSNVYRENSHVVIQCNVRDITERKHLSASLSAERSRLAVLNEELEGRVLAGTAQVQALARALSLAEYQERMRLSQILHDDLQQMLYSQRLHLGWLEDRLDTLDTAAVRGAIEQLAALTQQALHLTRSLATDIRPPVLGAEGLDGAIGELAVHMEQEYGVHVDVTGRANPLVHSREAQTFILQIVRELLFNVVKHAGVQSASIAIRVEDDRILVEIADEGNGFDPALGQSDRGINRGLGLRSIEERLSLVDGELRVESQPGAGTRVTLALPRERDAVYD